MTKESWRKEWQRVYDALPRDADPKWRFEKAHAFMRRVHGPEPPGFVLVLIQALLGFIKQGGRMKWDWTKTLWKAIRGAGSAALVTAVFTVLGAFDTEAELTESGVPTWLVPSAAMGVAFVISWLRNWIAINRPEWNFVKKAAEQVKG